MNPNNQKRLTKDIVVYENFIDDETALKLIRVLDRLDQDGNKYEVADGAND